MGCLRWHTEVCFWRRDTGREAHTQKTYTVVAATCEALGRKAVGREFGMVLSVETYIDATTALGIIQRTGRGTASSSQTQALWLQDVYHDGRASYSEVAGEANLATAGTKYLSEKDLRGHTQGPGVRHVMGRPTSCQELFTLAVGGRGVRRLQVPHPAQLCRLHG